MAKRAQEVHLAVAWEVHFTWAAKWSEVVRSGFEKQLVDELGQPPPARGFLRQATFAGPGDGVVLGVAVVLGLLPLPLDPAFLLEAHERRVERTLVERERVVRDLRQ